MISPEIDRHEQAETRRPKPIGLTYPEVRATGRREDASTPIPVSAMVPHQIAYVELQRIEGHAVAWTRDAVMVRYAVGGRDSHVWVWASAVNRT